MKVKIELFGAARDFSDQSLLELDLGQKTTIKAVSYTHLTLPTTPYV